MNYEEALAWLRGERSTINPYREHHSAKKDASITEQAYWIVRAHNEELVRPETHEHDWVDARNEVVESGFYCSLCGLLRPGLVRPEGEK